jgi:hypothetical protein
VVLANAISHSDITMIWVNVGKSNLFIWKVVTMKEEQEKPIVRF